MGRFIPNITVSPGPGVEFKIGLDWTEVKRHPAAFQKKMRAYWQNRFWLKQYYFMD